MKEINVAEIEAEYFSEPSLAHNNQPMLYAKVTHIPSGIFAIARGGAAMGMKTKAFLDLLWMLDKKYGNVILKHHYPPTMYKVNVKEGGDNG